jgi:hypothetical protein
MVGVSCHRFDAEGVASGGNTARGNEVSRLSAFAFAIILASTPAVSAFADDAAKPDLPAAPVNPPIHVSLGDSWTYDIRDDVTGDMLRTVAFVVTKVTDDEIEAREDRVKLAGNVHTTTAMIYDAHWHTKDDGKVIFRPYLGDSGVPEDLQVGKSWPIKYETQQKGAGLTREFAGAGKVEAWERVTLPNGSAYDAFKIDITLSAKLARKREVHAIIWFAPSINRQIKRIDESRDDGKLRDATEQTLREYKPAPKP